MFAKVLIKLVSLLAGIAMLSVVGPQVVSCPLGTTGVASQFCNSDPLNASRIDVGANIDDYLVNLRKIRSEFDYPLSRAQANRSTTMAHP